MSTTGMDATPSTTTAPTAGNGHIDVAALKAAAAGRWPEILANVGGIPRDYLHFDQREGPCPKCQGNTRFRGIDEATGALFCSHCHSEKNGDGISAIQWYTGKPFKEVVALLADYLHLNGNGRAPTKTKKAASEATLSKGIEAITDSDVMRATLYVAAARRTPSESTRSQPTRWGSDPA